jgi:hypothetical protein
MDPSNNQLMNSMNSLNQNITNLLDIFKEANQELKKDNDITLQTLNSKLDKLLSQHEKIADAIIALTEMVKGKNKTPIKNPNIPKPNIPPPKQVSSAKAAPTHPNAPEVKPPQPIPGASNKPTHPSAPSIPKPSNNPPGRPEPLKPLSLSKDKKKQLLGKPPKRP